MAAKPVKVAFLADTADLRTSLAKAEQAMEDAATEARSSGDKIDAAFTGVASTADGVASASSQAAGGLGDIAGALEATGLVSEGTAKSMETAAAAIMGVTGASDLLNLATEKIPGLQKVATAATNGLAAAKRALGVAIRFALGPIGLIILAVTAITAGLVLLYNKNEAFRNFVDGAWAKIKNAISAVFEWLRDKVPPIWEKVRSAAAAVADWFMEKAWPKIKDFAEKAYNKFIDLKEGVVTFATKAQEKVDAVKEKFGDIKDKVTEVVGSYKSEGGGVLGKLWSMVDTIGGLGEKITSKASGMWDGVGESFKGVINKMIGWWNNLSFSVDIPDKIPGLPDSFSITTHNISYLADGGVVTKPTLAVIGEAGPEAVVPLSRYGAMGGVNYYSIQVNAPVGSSPEEIGRTLTKYVEAYERAGGRRAA